MGLCDGWQSPLNLADPCVRTLWGAFIPGICVVVLYLFYIPVPRSIRRLSKPLTRKFEPFLTLEEAEFLATAPRGVGNQCQEYNNVTSRSFKQCLFILFGIAEVVCWLSHGCYFLVGDPTRWWLGARALALAFAWSYTVVRPITHPPRTAPYALLVAYVSLLTGWLVELGGIFYEHSVYNVPLPSSYALSTFSVHLCAIVIMLSVLLSMPLAIPPEGVQGLSEDYTTLWGWASFSWIYPVLKDPENDPPIWDLSPTLQSLPLFLKFHQISRPTILRKILASISLDLILAFSLTCASVCLNYAGPIFLKYILDEIDHERSSPSSKSKAYILAFLAFISALAKSQVDVQRFWFSHRASVRVRSELIAALFDKALDLKNPSNFTAVKGSVDSPIGEDQTNKSGADAGKTLNLMSEDVNKVSDTIATVHVLISAPLEILVASIILYHLLGWNAFAGFLVLLVIAPLSLILLIKGNKIDYHLSKAKDKRVGLLKEVLMAIKYIKLRAEEDDWADRVSEERETELKCMKKAWVNTLQLNFLWTSIPILVSIISLWAYISQGNLLSISTIFTAITLFNMIQRPLSVLPSTLEKITRVDRASLERISAYLLQEEVSARQDEDTHTTLTNPVGEGGLGFDKASFAWSDRRPLAPASAPPDATDLLPQFELRNLDIRFPEGKITIVDGPTGSGKSALLLALLGEMTLTAGRVLQRKEPSQMDAHGLKPLISYASQVPWLQQVSIKDNILFGHTYDESRYHEVIEACGLDSDLDQMENGEDTEVGARGVTLSDGQKARVALARAIYARTNYVLLDDPLSTFDNLTTRILYERLIRGSLLAHRTVVLVTRQVDLVCPSAHYFVQMRNGRIDVQDTVENLLSRSFWDRGEFPRASLDLRSHYLPRLLLAGTPRRTPGESIVGAKAKKPPQRPPGLKLLEFAKSEWTAGRVRLSASFLWPWLVLITSLIFREVIALGEKLWIKNWGEASGPFRGNWPEPTIHPYFYLGIFASMGLGHLLIEVLSMSVVRIGASRVSDDLLDTMFTTVTKAPLSFHDSVSPGQILNHFSRDLNAVDNSLIKSAHNVGASLVGVVASVSIILAVFPGFLLPALFIGYGYWQLGGVYVNSSREFRQREADTRSSILSHFNEVLEGSVIIRAFSAKSRFMNDVHENIDTMTRMWHMFWMTNRWLLLNFDCLSALVVLVTSLFAIPTPKEGAAWAAVCITSAMAFTNSIYWGCRFLAYLGLDLSSVENIVINLTLRTDPASEPPDIYPYHVSAKWPSVSRDTSFLVVKNLTVHYAPKLPPALSNVSFKLKAGERVGVLGHTGSGKSTLATSILRFIEPTHGKITIDNVDISRIDPHILRSRLTFVPQDPPFLSGTLRYNLDPFGNHEEQDLEEVLQRVRLITPNANSTSLPRTNKIHLNMPVELGGANFSQGEKQLISLAKALLRRSAIIILDKSTCSIDTETEAKIRQVLREELEGRLLISMVHQLRHVMDYDKVIILDKGSIAEFDAPWDLIERKDGIFRDFCLESGFFSDLEAIAREKREPLVAL